MYKVKNKTFSSYNAAVNNALRAGAAIYNERGEVIPTMKVTDKVTYNGQEYTVYQIKRDGVILADSSRHTVTIEGDELAEINRKPKQQPRLQAYQVQPQQFSFNF